MHSFLDFEEPIAQLEGKVEELRRMSDTGDLNIVEEIGKFQQKIDKLLVQTYSKLSPMQKVQVARHPDRPHYLDFVNSMVEDYIPLAGDRAFADDKAILGGIGRFRGMACMFIGHEKGRTTQSRVYHNFGMGRPEGYRKAIRLMRLADKFQIPVVTLVDTAGAYPGMGAEQRGQAEAIARSMQTCLQINVPIISVILGEGGSGGAVALATSDRVYMFSYSVYSVISPEGCASILWRDSAEAKQAAEALKLTADDLLRLGVIDAIIAEPTGGAHREPEIALKAVADRIESALQELKQDDWQNLKIKRREKYLAGPQMVE